MKSQSGIISILTTIMISLLLLIITISMVSLMTGELRQATEADSSIKAYYAAESGAEEAILRIKNGSISYSGNSCSSIPVNLLSGLDVTCLRVASHTNTLTGTLAREQPLQLDIDGVAPHYINITWNRDGRFTGSTDTALPFTNVVGLPDGDSWDMPAMIEITGVSYPDRDFAPSEIISRTLLFKPTCCAASRAFGPSVNFSRAVSTLPASARCTNNVIAAEPYNCRVRIAVSGLNLTDRDYVFRIRPRYSGTSYMIQFLDSSGAPINVPDQMATIDVTARSGDVHRRVVQRVAIESGVASGLDYVLFSDTDIEKNCEISAGAITSGNCGQ